MGFKTTDQVFRTWREYTEAETPTKRQALMSTIICILKKHRFPNRLMTSMSLSTSIPQKEQPSKSPKEKTKSKKHWAKLLRKHEEQATIHEKWSFKRRKLTLEWTHEKSHLKTVLSWSHEIAMFRQVLWETAS